MYTRRETEMPELPEVETVVRELRPSLLGRRITSVWKSRHSLRRSWKRAWNAQLEERTIRDVRRRGKWIVVDLDDGRRVLLHLGMTGQLTVHALEEVERDHTHLIVGLDGDRQLRFRDIRRFGSASLFAGEAELTAFFDAMGLGPEPFDLPPGHWKKHMAATARCLKAVLLDQRVVAGVGNIYADESLFLAKLHPERRGCDLKPAESARLGRAVAAVLTSAIERRGSTIRDYVGGSGLQGEYQNEFRVYGRTGEPCPRCRTPISRIRLAGRSTHFCSECQPIVGSRE
jgi:formamidopyrimidine-DNA glycosylase